MTPQEFGERIRIQREARRLTVEELATRFKLSVSTLRAIEGGRLDNLPHAVYARGFVRSYAQAVGVSPEDLEAGIEALFPRNLFEDVPTVPGPLGASSSRPDRRRGDTFVKLAVILIFFALPIGAGWFVVTRYGNDIMELIKRPFFATSTGLATPVSEPAHSETAPVPQPAPVAQSVQPAQPAQPGEPAAPAGATSAAPPLQAAVPVPLAAAAPVPAETAPTASAAPTTSAAPTATLPLDGRHVSIQAREACWVQVTVDGESSRTFTIQPGETSVLPYTRRISLVLGNAGGVSIAHNGQPYVMTGRQNERRTLVFP